MAQGPLSGTKTDRRLPARATPRLRDLMVIVAISAGIFTLLAISGALGWVEAITASLVLSAAALAYFAGTTQPPSETETAPEGLSAATEADPPDLSEMLDALPIPAFHVSLDRRIDAANESARGLLRLRTDQRSLAASAIRNPAFLECLDIALSELPRTGRVELPLGPDTDRLWLAHIAPVRSSLGGALIVMEDHTGVRRAERARADFLANASHELRTPLTSLAGFIETMRGPARDDPEAWDHFLDIMFKQTERMKRLIKDLLSLSRIEFSEHRPPQTVSDAADVLVHVMASMVPLAAERDITLTCHGPRKGLRAVADADEMTQVAQNLISNALKYANPQDSVSVYCDVAPTLDAAQAEAGRRWGDVGRISLQQAPHAADVPGLWLRVEDTGPGIDRQHLPRLGQRFYRVDQSRGGDVPGTGLGLAIVKHIMARHRGGFMVESEPGKGSAFGVWFPALEYPTRNPEDQSRRQERAAAPLQAPDDALAKSL
ncbi:MAG: ATP-binding protein [Pseudomonadota bacterium]